VGKSDADVNEQSAADAWRNGVLYSNGNCAIRQLGIPTVSVPMGIMADIGMPVNLTFASKAYDDSNLFRYAYAFEKAGNLRQAPKRTPALPTDTFEVTEKAKKIGSDLPQLTATASVVEDEENKHVNLSGTYEGQELASLNIYVDGDEVDNVQLEGGQWTASIIAKSVWNGRKEERGIPDPQKAMVIVLATGNTGRSAGRMLFV
jgi:amidase